MEPSRLKHYKSYVLFALWSILACAMIGFWVTESVIVLQANKNSTSFLPPVVHVKSLVDSMMMDQTANKSFNTLVVMNRKNNIFDRFRRMDEVNQLTN